MLKVIVILYIDFTGRHQKFKNIIIYFSVKCFETPRSLDVLLKYEGTLYTLNIIIMQYIDFHEGISRTKF